MQQIKLNDRQKNAINNILRKYHSNNNYDSKKDCFIGSINGTPYDKFVKSKEDSYLLAKIIDISICPYCNEQYIYTVYNKKNNPIIRPEFDHFRPKSKHPEFQLTLTNLIPSCHACNSILKKDKDFDENNYINPYKKDFDSIMKFDLDILSADYLDPNNFEIIFQEIDKKSANNKLAKNNIEAFKLEERYKFHKDEVIKYMKTAKFYTNTKLSEISKMFSTNNALRGIENILFPDLNCEINKTSLGKLKKDISRKLLNIANSAQF